ncbi:MAG: peptidyl-prolyl cis-trans isomerase [Bacillus sp. (in: Bacteria)]|nr:peptidyl-prolyl cis-trans isomerase [Bacillus sp. (in: firmicutes)]
MILTISGQVNHTITIDPGVWIFDERKVDLDTYFSQENKNHQDQELENLSRAWDKQRKEGAIALSNGNVVTSNKKDLTEKSFGVPLYPFIKNANPTPNATTVVFKRSIGEDFQCSLEEAMEGIAGFSNNGNPLKENGPIHFYYRDGSNKDNPVTHIENIVLI